MTIVNHRLPELGYLLAPLVAVLWAAVVDLIRREIPDSISIGLTLWAILAESLGWLPFRWESLILGFIVALILGSFGFWLRSFGGGDVKLLAALGAALGFSALWTMLFWTALAGGVLALVAKWRGERELAFAPAIALGLIAFIVSESLA
ncbi:MAG TPA: prepilin peptidase [Nitrospiraceae bacterium]